MIQNLATIARSEGGIILIIITFLSLGFILGLFIGYLLGFLFGRYTGKKINSLRESIQSLAVVLKGLRLKVTEKKQSL